MSGHEPIDCECSISAVHMEAIREMVLEAIHGPSQIARNDAAHQLVGCMASFCRVNLDKEINKAHRDRARAEKSA